jgi:hypothetical protein
MPTFDIPDAAVEWLRFGARGMSSEAIFERMTGLPVGGGTRLRAPSDPSDLNRCLHLLRAVPEWQHRIAEMATVNDDWAGLVAVWPQLVALFDEEEPTGNAPRTWALMRKATGL